MHTLVRAGADVLELGMPFSDPMADGPTIQLACERSLAAGTSLAVVLDIVADFRLRDNLTPVVLMGYLNPVERGGFEQFANRAREVGVDGVLLVDLPPEEADEIVGAFARCAIDCIFLVAPTSTPERIAAIARRASGYLYYVSVKGVTGAAVLDLAAIGAQIAQIRSASDLPVVIGFGIRDPQTAAQVSRLADGVVVGSALVAEIEKFGFGGDPATDFARGDGILSILQVKLAAMRAAIDQESF
jgi:tryptophan synthase alpha chain